MGVPRKLERLSVIPVRSQRSLRQQQGRFGITFRKLPSTALDHGIDAGQLNQVWIDIPRLGGI